MRFAFLDEAGVSQTEPAICTSGPLIHADQELVAIERRLTAILSAFAEKHERGPDLVFSTKHVWSGAKSFKDIDLASRLRLLHDYIDVVDDFRLVIPAGKVMREWLMSVPRSPGKTQKDIDVIGQTVAYLGCLLAIEGTMRERWPSEVVQIVFENNREAKTMMESVHEAFRRPDPTIAQLVPEVVLQHVRSSIHFVKKSESTPMQLADVCAFFFRGFLSGHPHAGPFYQRLQPQMVQINWR